MLSVMLRSAPVLCAVIALSGASCTTLRPVSAGNDDIAAGARSIAGTSLIGVKGAAPEDQAGIDDTAAGLCAAGSWTPTECVRHGIESRE